MYIRLRRGGLVYIYDPNLIFPEILRMCVSAASKKKTIHDSTFADMHIIRKLTEQLQLQNSNYKSICTINDSLIYHVHSHLNY